MNIPFIALLLAACAAMAIVSKKMQYWLPSYVRDTIFLRKNRFDTKPTDIIFCIADHFEPGEGAVDSVIAKNRVNRWLAEYPKSVDGHSDADGFPPRHTWFFCAHDDKDGCLEDMISICEKGYGEIELHLHHDHIPPFPDTAGSLENKINGLLDRWGRLGIFGLDKKEGRKKFGFIHGDWALDNSRSGKHCGINNELRILSRCGCYADFTFPCLNEAQPNKINAIYYAEDDPDLPKSYNTGIDVRRGSASRGDLMIIQGPIGLRFKRNFPFLGIESANISDTDAPSMRRVDLWIRTGIRVKGKGDWVFVKVHSHGARETNAGMLLGEEMEEMYAYLEKKYNDGRNYRLHYVSAREMFNIIKAAEDAREGNPNQYRDYLVDKPQIRGDL